LVFLASLEHGFVEMKLKEGNWDGEVGEWLLDNETPLISVIIPTFNWAGYVELIESLYRQTYRQLQIIIVNDAGRGEFLSCIRR
jgi:cellulose synthase/poly-beta-1,6-N-acetylglucosamine synthase-like glycosyltransferase